MSRHGPSHIGQVFSADQREEGHFSKSQTRFCNFHFTRYRAGPNQVISITMAVKSFAFGLFCAAGRRLVTTPSVHAG